MRGIVELRDTGQTPAYDLTTTLRLGTQEAGTPFIPEPPGDIASLAQGILGRDSIIRPVIELAIPSENTALVPALQNRTGVIYLTGQAEYNDAFGKKWILDFRLRSHQFTGSAWNMAFTEEGNKETKGK